jgi:spermidine synthase
MGGLALGALIMSRYSDRVQRRLLLYGCLEFLITITAVSLPWVFGVFDGVYIWFYQAYELSGAGLLVVQVLVSACVLLVPSVLMGSTLPLLGRYVTSLEREAGHLVGRLYALNTLGAAAGCFAAGFVLIKWLGVMGSLYVAAVMNLGVACAGWILWRFSSTAGTAVGNGATSATVKAGAEKRFDGRFWVLVAALFLSGLISIGYELLWMRSIVHLLGGYTYVFSAVLTVYLLGNVIGAGIASGLVRSLKKPALGFATTLLLLGGFGVLYAPFLYFWTYKGMRYVNMQMDFLRWLVPFSEFLARPIIHSVFLFLVPSIIMGIGFPIALQAYANRMHLVGRSTGTAYGANTIGAVVGGIVTGFVLIPRVGVHVSTIALGLAGVGMAAILWLSMGGRRRLSTSIVVCGASVLAASAVIVPKDYFEKVVSRVADLPGAELVAVHEGTTTTVSVHRTPGEGTLHLYSSGQSLAGDNYTARGDQKMLAHLGVLLHGDVNSVLSVGFGSGETTRCLSLHDIERIDCVEIAPEVVEVSLEHFRHLNLGDRLDEEVNMIYMDAKNYLHLTDRTYDLIINDSIHPRVFADNASLYSKEYFADAADRLNQYGMVISWIPTYQMTPSVVNSIIGTLMEVCPHVTVWYLTPHPAPLILVAGSKEKQIFSPAAIEEKMKDKEIRASLAEVNIFNSLDLLSCYIGDEEDIRRVIEGYQVNSDYQPYIEFNTDEEMSGWVIVSRYVTELRSQSLLEHLDFEAMNASGTSRWLAQYERLYEVLGRLIPERAAVRGKPGRIRMEDERAEQNGQ